jgi:hypothetical protein
MRGRTERVAHSDRNGLAGVSQDRAKSAGLVGGAERRQAGPVLSC